MEFGFSIRLDAVFGKTGEEGFEVELQVVLVALEFERSANFSPSASSQTT